MNFRENSYGHNGLCLVYKEIGMDQWPLKFAKSSSERLALVHGWLFPAQKTREGCGPKSLAGRVFQQILTLLENSSRICRQREMLSLPRFGGCWIIGPSGTLLDFAEREEHFTLRSQIEGSCPTRLLLGPMALLQCPVPTPPKDLEICFFFGWL